MGFCRSIRNILGLGKNPEVYYNLGVEKLKKSSTNKEFLDQALENFNLALEGTPNHLRAFKMRGTTYFWQGKTDRARKDFLALVKKDPENETARLVLAALGLRSGTPGSRVMSAVEKVMKGEGNWYGRYLRGATYFMMGDYPKALEDFSWVLSFGLPREETGRLHFWLALSHFAEGQELLAQGHFLDAARYVLETKGSGGAGKFDPLTVDPVRAVRMALERRQGSYEHFHQRVLLQMGKEDSVASLEEFYDFYDMLVVGLNRKIDYFPESIPRLFLNLMTFMRREGHIPPKEETVNMVEDILTHPPPDVSSRVFPSPF